jgi:taurine dioxygenase
MQSTGARRLAARTVAPNLPFAVSALSPLGAEVSGLDLKAALGAGDAVLASHLRDALNKHGLLLFRNQQDLLAADHVQCAELFGSIFKLPERFQHPRSPLPFEILRISNDASEGCVGIGTSGWHIDGTSYEKPFQLALMHIIASPESPAPTLFLPLSPLADRLRHHAPSWDRLWLRNGKGTHPLLYSHPRTGAPGVCLGKVQSFLWDDGEGGSGPLQCVADEDETAATLAELHAQVEAYASDGGRVYAHEWRAGDLLLVDNLAVAHLAPPETQLPREEAGLRILHRIVVAGSDALPALRTASVGGTEPGGGGAGMARRVMEMGDLFSKTPPPDAQRLASRAREVWPEWTCDAYPASPAGRFQESCWWEASGREKAAEERCLVTAGRATLWPEGGGAPIEIRAGEWATFRRGFLCEWVVHEPIAKRYAYFDEAGAELL